MVGEGALAAGPRADAEPVGTAAGDQAGEPGDRAGGVPVGHRPAVHQVDMPGLAIMPDDVRVDRIAREQGVEPVCYLSFPAG